MAITINGTGSITGLTAGGLPDGSVTAADIASGVIPAALSNAEDGAGTDFEFNSGYGSNATAYGVRAWIHFQGTGTVSINGHGNISGLTDEGTGEYTISFTNAMPDANYAIAGSAKYPSATNHHVLCAGGSSGEDPAAGSLRFQTIYIDSHATQDCEQVTVMVVR